MALEIFICYRRKDTGGYAGRLYDHLVQRFGRDGVLIDVSAGGTAELLREWVVRVVPNASALLVLIGDTWLADRDGRRRLHESDDIVRLEIELALKHEIPIIPVMIDGAAFPATKDLPASIEALARFKGYELNNNVWEGRLEPLIEAIASVTKSHIHVLKRGVPAWNAWRMNNPAVKPRLTRGAFSRMDFSGANFNDVDLSGADLSACVLQNAQLRGADLNRTTLSGASLENADLYRATLRSADLSKAVLKQANLERADLSDANLNECDFTGALVTDCRVYGVSAWNTRLENARQGNLRLSRSSQSGDRSIRVDTVQTAVVVNLLLESGGVSALLETLSSKTVLVLGRFTPEKRAFFEVVKNELFDRNYVAVSFDFAQPTMRSLSETLTLLASISRFIVADLTDPKAVPVQLQQIVPQLPSVPIVPLIEQGQVSYAMFGDLFRHYSHVLAPTTYESNKDVGRLIDQIVETAEAKISERLQARRLIEFDTENSVRREPNSGDSKPQRKRSRRKRPRQDDG